MLRALIPLMLLCLALLPASARQPEPDSNFARAEAAFRAGEYATAVDLYRAAHEQGMDHPTLHFRLGFSLHVLGRIGEALPHHLRGAGSMNRPIRIDCIYNAACAHALLSNPDDALRYLQYAIDVGFTDTAQLARDTDLDSIRPDPRFQKLIDSIGVEPRLYEQLDFMVGHWQWTDEAGQTTNYRFERPAAGSSAITYHVVASRLAWIGVVTPDAVDRTWELVFANDLGTTYRFTGVYEDNAVTFTGRSLDVGGPGIHARFIYKPGPDGSLVERVENSLDDGLTWVLHHEERLERAVEPTP